MSSLSKDFITSFYPQLYDYYLVIKNIEADQYIKLMRSSNEVKAINQLDSTVKGNQVTHPKDTKHNQDDKSQTKQNKDDKSPTKKKNRIETYWDIGFSGMFYSRGNCNIAHKFWLRGSLLAI
jgi:hypothetical protein